MFLRAAAALALAVSLIAPAAAQETLRTEKATLRLETVANGLARPWALAFLPDGRMLVTERAGRIRIVDGKGIMSKPLAGVPEVEARGQGGMLDIALHPRFAENRLVYLSYSEAGEGGVNGTAVARGRLVDGPDPALADVSVIFRQEPKVASAAHFGSRLAFDREGYLYVSLGERQATRFRVHAQDLDYHFGKVVRLFDDGRVPPDNPFVGRAGARPEIWSYGHRNPQGLAVHPETGRLWLHEHGPRGGDEINIVEKGANYGWPEFSYGTEYSGLAITRLEHHPPEFVEPIYYWVPSIAPSGMAFYSANAIPGWKGNLLVGALVLTKLVRLELDGEKVTHQEDLLTSLGKRIRDVRVGPDGSVYLLTDEPNGEILKLSPA